MVLSEIWPLTPWTVIARARGHAGTPEFEQAWRVLFPLYREPIERCMGYWLARLAPRRQDADDLAATFLSDLWCSAILPKVDADVGRMRAYLQGVLRRWIHAVLREESLTHDDLELLKLAHPESDPEFVRAEEQAWAEAFLARAVAAHEAGAPREALALALTYGIRPHRPTSRTTVAERLETSPQNLDVILCRARNGLRRELENEVRSTCADPASFAGEWRVMVERLRAAHPDLFDPA